MSKDKIQELVPRVEPYSGEISEKAFISAIKGCKTIDLKDIFVSKQIQQSILDNDENNSDNESIIIKGYFEMSVKKSDNKNKLDFIIKELEEMKKNTLTIEQLEIVVEKVVDEKVNPRLDNIENRLDNMEQDIKEIKECPTIANELRTKNMN